MGEQKEREGERDRARKRGECERESENGGVRQIMLKNVLKFFVIVLSRKTIEVGI